MPKEVRGDAYDLLRSTCASCLATSLNGFLADGQFKQLAMNLNSKSAALVGPPLSGSSSATTAAANGGSGGGGGPEHRRSRSQGDDGLNGSAVGSANGSAGGGGGGLSNGGYYHPHHHTGISNALLLSRPVTLHDGGIASIGRSSTESALRLSERLIEGSAGIQQSVYGPPHIRLHTGPLSTLIEHVQSPNGGASFLRGRRFKLRLLMAEEVVWMGLSSSLPAGVQYRVKGICSIEARAAFACGGLSLPIPPAQRGFNTEQSKGPTSPLVPAMGASPLTARGGTPAAAATPRAPMPSPMLLGPRAVQREGTRSKLRLAVRRVMAAGDSG